MVNKVTYTPHMLLLCCVWYAYGKPLIWRLTIHSTLLYIMLCWRLTYTTHFQIYFVLEVLDVVLEVYHTQRIFKHAMYVLLEVVDGVLEVYHTQHTFKHMLCWR